MLIPETKIEEVRERADLVALVQRHGVELKKSGRSLKGLCPFHQEKTPSFYVFPEGKRFKCFGCQAGGDAIAFLQRLLGKPFVDTVRDLAKELGIDLEGAVDPQVRERSFLKDVTDAAARHFEERLWDTAVGHHAREYLRGRGLSDEVMRSFGLGWAPVAWTELSDRLRQLGLLAFGEKAGLLAHRPRADGYYDVFRGRVMIPIRSPEGRVIGFGGRLVEGEEGPKYLNSRENPLFNKSEVLFGSDRAREEIRKKKAAILCEGYFDCIALHQAQVRHAVALCSTALTPGHLALLTRMEAKELILLLDGDAAGRSAVERLAGALLAAGASAKVALLPEGEDPDTFLRKAGPSALQDLLGRAQTLTQHLFLAALPEGPSSSFEAKMAAIDRLRPVVAQVPQGLSRSAFFGALARHTGLLASELEVAMRGKKPPPVRAVPKPASKEALPDQLEAVYAAALLRNPTLGHRDPHRVADELKHLGLRTLVGALQTGQREEELLFEAKESVKQALRAAADQLPADDAALERAFATVCRRLKLRAVEEQLQRIARETAQVEGGSELTSEARTLLEERGQLLALKRELSSPK